MALAEAQMLRQHLESTGASGQANILRKQQAGDPIQRFAPFFVEVLVQPDAMGFPFQCSVTTWIDTSKGMLTASKLAVLLTYCCHSPLAYLM